MIKDGEALSQSLVADLAGLTGTPLAQRRHDMNLNEDTFKLLGLSVTQRQLREMRRFGDFAGKERLYEASTLLAERVITEPLGLSSQIITGATIDSMRAISANCRNGKGK